jgi:hypothetical protein
MKNYGYILCACTFLYTTRYEKHNTSGNADSNTEEAVKLNDQPYHNVCSMCQQPIIILKHTVMCGCGSKIKSKVKFKIYPEKQKSPQ